MTGFIQGVQVVLTIVMLLLLAATLFGRFPRFLMFKVNAGIAGVCWVGSMILGDGSKIALGCIAFTVWTAAAIAHHYNARRQARQAAGGQTP